MAALTPSPSPPSPRTPPPPPPPQAKWEASDSKPQIVATGAAALVALYRAAGGVGSVDRLPVLPTFFELVGLAVSAWFAYRVVAFPEERASFKQSVIAFAASVGLEL